ncbi:MAG: TetR/AcrR family transcriptional regulator [Lachnospiraceae bacterium]|nr:TetR/AcrR family transcriptional regulator [Lachnospiraceae bacterium]
MSEKTEKKRDWIIRCAHSVFALKGYRCVTMKDIVEASSISRGGLYLYFSSVEEVFLAVLDKEEKRTDEDFANEQLQTASNVEMLLWFLKAQKKEILQKKGSLLTAKYEYAFACRENKKSSPLQKEMKKASLVLQKLLERGIESGEFVCFDSVREAENMMLAIEGMKVIACTTGIGEKKVDSEFLYMMQRIVPEEI